MARMREHSRSASSGGPDSCCMNSFSSRVRPGVTERGDRRGNREEHHHPCCCSACPKQLWRTLWKQREGKEGQTQ